MLDQITTGPTLWFANRATGVVLVTLLTLVTATGIFSTARTGTARWPRFATQALHRNTALLAMVMLAGHAVTAVVDTYVDIRWYDVFVPFVGKYSPTWLAIGTISVDLMVAVLVTSLVRQRMSHLQWRAVHLLSYLGWGLGVAHGFGIGTDSRTIWGLTISGLSVAVVGVFGVVRLVTLDQERRIDA
jgi:predicted ferric reductase